MRAVDMATCTMWGTSISISDSLFIVCVIQVKGVNCRGIRGSAVLKIERAGKRKVRFGAKKKIFVYCVSC